MTRCKHCKLLVDRYGQPGGMDEAEIVEWWDMHNEDWCQRCGGFAAYGSSISDEAVAIRTLI